MKIIYYSPHPYLNLSSPSGYGTHMREMIAAFESLGHEVFPLIAGGTEIPLKPSSDLDSGRQLTNGIKRFVPKIIWETLKDLRLLKVDASMKIQLLDLIDRVQPDFIYERGNYIQCSGVEAANEKGVKHFIELNAPYIKERIELQGGSMLLSKAEKIEKKLLHDSTRVFVISTSLKEYFQNKNPDLNESHICAIPNAINPEKFKSNLVRAHELKNKYGFDNDSVVVGFVGSILKWHGVDILIDAFNKSQINYPKARLLIVGSGEVFDDLQLLVQKLGIGEKVVFTGNVPHDQVPDHIEIMDITVIAKTNWYCSPIKIFEYAALNKVVLASDHAPIVEVMDNDVHGIITKSEPDKMSEALDGLLQDENLRNSLAKNFHNKVLAEHTWLENAKKVIAELDKKS